jgi:hypothetical protein
MDPIENPFSPGAGCRPPRLAGRDAVLAQAKVLLGRGRRGQADQSLLLTGLHGMGKTVALGEIERMARDARYQTVFAESVESKSLCAILAPRFRGVLFELARGSESDVSVKRALAVLYGLMRSLKLPVGDFADALEIAPETGAADSGDLEADFTQALVAIGEAAAECGGSIAILVDNLQCSAAIDLSALLAGVRRVRQLALPIVLFGAGLPDLPTVIGEATSVAESRIEWVEIGALLAEETFRALEEPVEALGISFEPEALVELYRQTHGIPYFVQEWGFQSWNRAPSTPVTLLTVRQSAAFAIQRLDSGFYGLSYERLSPGERRYLRVMAEADDGATRTGEIADRLGVKITSLGPLRATLMRKGMIYSPAHGELAFTAPLYAEFLRRVMPEETAPVLPAGDTAPAPEE